MKTWIIAALVVGAQLQGQSVQARLATPADRTLLTALIAAEDSRDLERGRATFEQGLASSNPYLRAFTARGLGRLENPSVLALVAKAIADSSAEVRAAGADALAQSVARPLAAAATDADRRQNSLEVGRVRDTLAALLYRERDPAVRALALESVGRLPQGSAEQVRSTAEMIALAMDTKQVAERRGVIRGLFFLARKREARAPGRIPTPITDRLYAMLGDTSAGLSPTDRFNVAFALWGAFALNDARAAQMLDDREPFVRERAAVQVARSSDTALIRGLLARAMADPAPVVRFRALNTYSLKLRATDGCGPLVAMTTDSDMSVALGAVDALSACHDAATVQRLRSLAEQPVDGDRWHLPTHAFVSLAVADSGAARAMMPRFMTARNFFVRMYADTAARLMHDVASLYLLSRDSHPNVQASAVVALSLLAGHAADSVYVRSLASEDNQVIMSAAAALKGSTVPGLLALVDKRLAERDRRAWDTDRYGLEALEELSKSLGGAPRVVGAYVPRIALPNFADLAALERATATIEMADGSTITFRLHPFDAPTNAFRFARLARARTFDGLTFHRVAPFFVVQGPSPNANEYSGPDKPFSRDELGLSNVHGSVGLSTRYRDAGDGQIYVNTVDNVWLDHEYTVMGTITSGLEFFDRMQEGARIRRVTITP
jgi:cyclophilin family peptidyl-prolyl cis-trans isomerase